MLSSQTRTGPAIAILAMHKPSNRLALEAGIRDNGCLAVFQHQTLLLPAATKSDGANGYKSISMERV